MLARNQAPKKAERPKPFPTEAQSRKPGTVAMPHPLTRKMIAVSASGFPLLHEFYALLPSFRPCSLGGGGARDSRASLVATAQATEVRA